VRQGATALDVVDAEDFAAIRRFDAPPAGMVCEARSDAQRLVTSDKVHTVALALDVCQSFEVVKYGEVWPVLYAFFCWLVRPHQRHKDAADTKDPPITVYLPAGDHLGHRGRKAFEEVQAIFAAADGSTRITFERAAWVPFCQHSCCLAEGRVPSKLRAQGIELLYDFPNHEHEFVSLRPEPRAAFQRDIRSFLLGTRPTAFSSPAAASVASAASAAPAPVLVTWLRSSRGTNGRRILNEEILISALRTRLSESHPSWRLEAVHGEALSYADEARLITRSSILISLFGSSLHNCRFLARGSIVLELHGALADQAGQDWFYYNLCANGFGMRWVGLPLEPAYPESSRRADRLVATVSPAQFVDFFAKITAGKWQDLLGGYAAAIRRRRSEQRERRHDHADAAPPSLNVNATPGATGHGGGASGGLPLQYSLQRVPISRKQRAWLEAQPLPDVDERPDAQCSRDHAACSFSAAY
jgi:hypothetical protein